MDRSKNSNAVQNIQTAGQRGRENYLRWGDYFMATALLAAKRSKDPNTQVGACVVNTNNRIVGIGYNGMPVGCRDDEFPWDEGKHYYVCHAEMNALVGQNSGVSRNCTMYVSLFPCNECAKIIIQAGITKVVYLSEKADKGDETKIKKKKATREMFIYANVELSQFIPTDGSVIEIKFQDKM